MRALPDDLAPAVASAVDERLQAIEREQGVRVLWAVESGSRAWGFPSPDSDYDCRFVYVRPLADYLTPWPRRDTIEVPIEDDLDLSGWDLGKALALLLKGNAVALEWLSSPIVYFGDPALRDQLLDLAARHGDRIATAHHYLSLGERQRQLHLADAGTVPIKKVFYTLRPAAALRWLRAHPTGVPPMRLEQLLEEADASAAVRSATADLIRRKADACEAAQIAVPTALSRWMDKEFELTRANLPSRVARDNEAGRMAAEALFRTAVLET